MGYVSLIGRIAKSAGRLMVMDTRFCGKFEKCLADAHKINGFKGAHKSIWSSLKAAEKETCGRSFRKDIWEQIKSTPKELKGAWAKSGWWTKTKGIGGVIGKRLPLLFVAMEIPNIYRAYRDKGLVGGTIEAGKSLIRGASGMAGFAIGQTLIPIPILGGLIGAFAGDWLASKIVGKSHTENLEEAEAQQNGDALQYQDQMEQMQQMMQQNPQLYPYSQTGQNLASINIPKPTMNPQQIMQMGQMLYGGGMINPMDQDFMAMTSGINNLGRRLNFMS